MALTNDTVQFILDVNAQGAQQEISSLEQTIGQLNAENKELERSLKTADKEISQLEKSMLKLEKAGKQQSQQYQDLQRQYAATSQRAQELRNNIQQNTKAATDSKKKHDELINSLKNEQLTMNQLQQKAKQLQAQLNATSRAASPETYRKLQTELKAVERQVQSLKGQYGAFTGVVNSAKKAVQGFAKSTIQGAVFGLVTEGIQKLVEMWKKAGEERKRLLDIQKEATDGYAQEASKIKSLQAIAENADLGYDKRNAALQELKAIVPDYHASLDAEGKLINNNADAIDRYIDNMKREIQFQVYRQKLAEAYAQQINAEEKKAQAQARYDKDMQAAREARSNTTAVTGGAGSISASGAVAVGAQNLEDAAKNNLDKANSEADKELKQAADSIKFIEDRLQELEQKSATTHKTVRQNVTQSAKVANEQKEVVQDPLKLQEQLHKQLKEELQRNLEEETLIISKQYANQEITEAEYRKRLLEAQDVYYRDLRELEIEFGGDVVAVEQKIQDARIAANKAAADAMKQMGEESQKVKEQLSFTAQLLGELQTQSKAAGAVMEASLGKTAMTAITTATEGIQKMANTLNDANATTQEKAAATVAGVGGAVQQALNLASQAMTKMFEIETNKLTAQKNKELAVVGENEEEREKIDRKYAEKQLELQKKQAQANAALQTSQLWINTAMGIATAWATSMQLGPIAGPIVAAILTAGLLATAGIEQAAIIKQRDAITSQTLDSSSISSGESSTPTPSSPKVSASLKDEYDTTNGAAAASGFAEGGYTGNGGRYQVAGVVHKGEYVVARPELQQPQIAAMVSNIESVRQRRLSGSDFRANGFADGGYTNYSSDSQNSLTAAINRLNRQLSNPIVAKVNYRELQSGAQKEENRRSRLRG